MTTKFTQIVRTIKDHWVYITIGVLIMLYNLMKIIKEIILSIDLKEKSIWDLPIFSASVLDSILMITLVIVLFKILFKYEEFSKKISKLDFDIQVFNIVSHVRNKRLLAEFDANSRENALVEYEVVKKIVQQNKGNRTVNEIEDSIRKFYPTSLF